MFCFKCGSTATETYGMLKFSFEKQKIDVILKFKWSSNIKKCNDLLKTPNVYKGSSFQWWWI